MYRECSVVQELIGSKWVHHILLMLQKRPHKFNKINQLLPQLSPTILSATLKKMIGNGLIWRNGAMYTLTPFGVDISVVVMAYVVGISELKKKQFGGLQPLIE
jgi:DNA-binding HxlR family transcriptional regulator